MLLYFKVGEGSNTFDKTKNYIEITRNNFPWKKDKLTLNYKISDVLRNLK